LGKTESDTTVNPGPAQTRNLLLHFSQNTREDDSADSSRDILQAIKGEKEGATYDSVWHDGQNHSPEGTTLKSRPEMLVDPRLNAF